MRILWSRVCLERPSKQLVFKVQWYIRNIVCQESGHPVTTADIRMLRLVVLLSAVWCGVSALDNGLARTPPMGWLVWERFRCNTNCTKSPDTCISEKLFMEMADRMAEDGYKAVGYEYINIDDCWSYPQRDTQGRLQADPDRFPSGIKGLADYVHKRGLKLGIYADYGTKTCAGYPGSIDHLQLDAQTFADWGVDMLKLDGCNCNVTTMNQGYPEMMHYLNQTGRPILFSCNWPSDQRDHDVPVDYRLVAENCNIWRNYWDIDANWPSLQDIIDYYSNSQDLIAPVQGPGAFNDPDMILAGDAGLTTDQAKTQMALWAIFSSPLLMSNDLRSISQDARDILLNTEIIAVNQDPDGHFGKRIGQTRKGVALYSKPLSFDRFAIVIFNRANVSQVFAFSLQEIYYPNQAGYFLRDLYLHQNAGAYQLSDTITVTVNATGVVMLRADPILMSVKGGRSLAGRGSGQTASSEKTLEKVMDNHIRLN